MSSAVVADEFLGGKMKLLQSARGHRAGTDAVLLAAAAPFVAGLVIDAGAGVGAVGIAAALRMTRAQLELIEFDPQAAALARENLALNGLAARAWVKEASLGPAAARRAAGVADGRAELVLVNPPFYENDSVRSSPDPLRARAHVLSGGGLTRLEDWVRAATALAAGDGAVVLIHRADRLDALLACCARRLGGLAVLPIHPKAEAPAARVIVGGRRGSRAPLRLLPGLTLHDDHGAFTPQAEALHRGEATLALL